MAFDQSELAFGVCYVEGRDTAQVFFTPRRDIVETSKTVDKTRMRKLREEVLRLWADEVTLAEKSPMDYTPIARPYRANRALFEC